MDSQPPMLLYLVIYNPSLKGESKEDDEDAAEQAHVLFYTAREHAVSKDRVLRQVGLAKALVNFTAMFDPQSLCDSVHSQNRRMILLSPEPNFWMHACVELSKRSRTVKSDSKGKGKLQETVYDHSESSLHDEALRSRLLLAYEAFILTHGSLSSILSTLGREALELQLERYFTTWAWSWNFDKKDPFSDYLGIRIHPLNRQLTPLIATVEDALPPHYETIIIANTSLVISKDASPVYPPSLPRHLLSFVPRPAVARKSADDAPPTNSNSTTTNDLNALGLESSSKTNTVQKRFLGVPAMNVNMDVRKWNWPGYLTFGTKNHSNIAKEPNNLAESQNEVGTQDDKAQPSSGKNHEEGSSSRGNNSSSSKSPKGSVVDSVALKEALTSVRSNAVPWDSEANHHIEDKPARDVPEPSGTAELVEDQPTSPVSSVCGLQDGLSMRGSALEASRTIIPGEPVSNTVNSPIQFSETYVHLPEELNGLPTCRRLIRYLTFEDLLFALIPTSRGVDESEIDEDQLEIIAEKASNLLERLKELITVEEGKIAAAFPSSPVQSVLQKSQYAVAISDTLSSTSNNFSSSSWYLHSGRRLLRTNSDLLEVFSRGQNPQDWYLVKRGSNKESGDHGDVFMEIGRKEASLTDVDNEISGVIRRFGDS